jgi:hypothetical protein
MIMLRNSVTRDKKSTRMIDFGKIIRGVLDLLILG